MEQIKQIDQLCRNPHKACTQTFWTLKFILDSSERPFPGLSLSPPDSLHKVSVARAATQGVTSTMRKSEDIDRLMGDCLVWEIGVQ